MKSLENFSDASLFCTRVWVLWMFKWHGSKKTERRSRALRQKVTYFQTVTVRLLYAQVCELVAEFRPKEQRVLYYRI